MSGVPDEKGRNLNAGKRPQARAERRRMLADLRRVVRVCECEWPIVKYRNGDGHHDECPAHRPLGAARSES